MSALAKLCVNLNYSVSGTDDNQTEITEELTKLGVSVFSSSAPIEVKQADIVVFTIACANHADLALAKSLNKTIYERAEFLGKIAGEYSKTIAIAGTHGKSTTTALIGHIFTHAGLNPTVHLGANSPNLGGNLRVGSRDFFITEACEYNRSFLQIYPDCSVITNIDLDHPDTYASFDELQSAFSQFFAQTKSCVIRNANGIKAKNIKSNSTSQTFEIHTSNSFLFTATINLPGAHNIENALSSIAVALYYNIPTQKIIEALASFKGISRRFEKIGESRGSTHILDYAHHPTEIKALISTILPLAPLDEVVAIFQPHTYSRTLALMPEFVSALSAFSNLILLPTFASREQPIPGGYSTDLFFNLTTNQSRQYCSSYYALRHHLDSFVKSPKIILWIGAGDIEKIAKTYLADCNKANKPKIF